jgi:hypothetical protein
MKWIVCLLVLLLTSAAAGQNYQINPFPGEIARPIYQPSLPLPICQPQYE